MQNTHIAKKVLATLGGAVFTLSSSHLLAQEVQNVNESRSQIVEEEIVEEEIVVQGIRQSLESALEVKRSAASIVDHISAEDIGSFPALDFGEALQAIPGVQLNAEGVFRESSVNLRGLSGGFIRTTANGFGFASPSLSARETGAENPFGAFETGVFRGVTVIKTPTADLQTGSIAGIIDKKLPRALRTKRDELTVKGGTRYEQLNDSFDPEFTVRASKMLIEDVLAVSGAIAGSKQRFRRDTINFTRYEELEAGFFPEVEEYKAERGLEDAKLLYASEVRQFSESANGERLSYSFNIGYQATESLAINLDLLGTERDLNDNRQDVFIVGARQKTGSGAARRGIVDVTPTAGVEPVFGFTVPAEFDDDGNQVSAAQDNYVVTDYSFDNGQYYPGNRDADRTEETKGFFLTADWEQDRWAVHAGISSSKAEASRINAQFDARFQPLTPNADGFRSNGITGRLSTGRGDLDNYSLELQGFENLDLNGGFEYQVNPNSGSQNQPDEVLARQLTRTQVQGATAETRNTRFFATSNEQFVERDFSSFQIDVEYEVDASIFDSIKFGAYNSDEDFSRAVRQHSAAYINLDGISNDLLQSPEYTQGNEFFNGTVSGYAGAASGWQAIDVAQTLENLTPGILDRYNADLQAVIDLPARDPNDPDANTDILTQEEKDAAIAFYSNPELTSLGFLRRRNNSDETNFYEASTQVSAAYIMSSFSGRLGAVPFSGNLGFRYAKTKNEAEGFTIVDDELVLSDPENSYSHTLPSLNLAFDFRDDLILRAAYYEGLVRPNVASFRPNGFVDVRDRSVRIRVPDSTLEPFEADSLDLTLSWYNRQGSVFSLGYFVKDVRDAADTVEVCPEDGGGFGFGTLTLNGEECTIDATTTITDPDTGEVEEINKEIQITQTLLKDDERRVKGIEAIVQQNFDFLPAPWSYFGGSLSYARVTNDGRQIPGISKESYNAIGYFETEKFNTRLSYNYRDDYLLNTQSSFTGFEDRNVKARGRLDMSVSYKFLPGLRVTFKAINVLDEIYEEFQANNTALPKRTNYDGRIYILDATYRF